MKRKIKTRKVFLKAFKITNENGEFTREDFELLRSKLEVIRKVYFYEEEQHDFYDGFRTVVKEIKRASHNAHLNAEIVDLNCKYFSTSVSELDDEGKLIRNKPLKHIRAYNNSENTVEFNLCLLLKGGARLNRDDSFVITGLLGFDKMINLLPNNEEEPEYYQVDLNEDLCDETEPTYIYTQES